MFATYFIFIVLSTSVISLTTGADDNDRYRGHVIKQTDSYLVYTAPNSTYIEPNSSEHVLAKGFWDQTYNITGWSVLEIQTFDNDTNSDQAYAAGLLEGRLTKDLIAKQKINNIDDICSDKTFCEKLSKFLNIQLDWIYTQIANYPNDEYWHQINLLLVQLNGLIDGNADTEHGPRTFIDDPINGLFLFQIVESTGELAERLGFPNVERRDSCSALIKILPGNEDIFVSHADWSAYKSMLKVIKRYSMPLKRSSANDSATVSGSDTIFSSYPGTLHSIDDFYMTYPARMTIIETTIVNNNSDIAHNILPISVPEWMRVVVANRLSNSGKEWVDKFFLFNDGTYNNEWMISDFKQFTPKNPPTTGFLTMAEQLVTYYQIRDMTDILNEKGYWASYNNVYFPDFRKISGEDDSVTRFGPQLYSWTNSSRANIFRRDSQNVSNLDTMIKMMRYNNFKVDEYSKCDCNPPYSAELTIAARCDLNDPNGKYPDTPLGYRAHGATDAKITSYAHMQNHEVVAIAGPTTDQQPPFVWSTSGFNHIPHVGHPDKWDFGRFTPKWELL